MTKSDMPDDLINKLSALQNKYVSSGALLTDEDLLTEAIMKVQKEYQFLLLASEITTREVGLRLGKLRVAMIQLARLKVNRSKD